MKRILLVLLVIVLAGCHDEEITSLSQKPYVVFAAPFDNHPIWNEAKRGFYDACKEFDLNCDWDGPTVISKQYMETAIETAILKKADGIITQGVVDAQVIDKAFEKGIPTILVDADVNNSKRIAYFSKDFEEQAKLIVEDIKTKHFDVPIKVAVQVAKYDFDIAPAQISALENELKNYITESEVVAVSESNSESIQARNEWIRVLNENKEINVIVNFAGESTPEAVLAVKNLGIENVIVYGVDELPRTIELVKNGDVEGTIATSFYNYGFNAVAMMDDVIGGRPINKENAKIDIKLITKESLNYDE